MPVAAASTSERSPPDLVPFIQQHLLPLNLVTIHLLCWLATLAKKKGELAGVLRLTPWADMGSCYGCWSKEQSRQQSQPPTWQYMPSTMHVQFIRCRVETILACLQSSVVLPFQRGAQALLSFPSSADLFK
eukprot:509987-Pelagomonas_calceolata.AAC.1